MGEGERAPLHLKAVYRILSFVFLVSLAVGTDAQNLTSTNCVPASKANDLSFAVTNCQQLEDSQPFYLGFVENVANETLKIVLAVPKMNRWYAIGFNSRPQMIGTNCVIGWVNETSGQGMAYSFHLSATDVSGVNQDKNSIDFTVHPALTTIDESYYLTFELNITASKINLANTIFAEGVVGDIPNDTGFTSNNKEHELEITTSTNFQTGAITVVKSTLSKKATAHGIINIIGWGLLLPLGAIIARYAKGFDPAWFYLHATFQVAGFAFIIAGLVTGFQVDNIIPTNIDDTNHKTLGVIIFILASLQVTALLLRPQKEAKLRRYWNWGHWWIGRVSLLLGAINIFVGIHIASGGKGWKAAYAIILVVELVSIAILETFLWVNYLKVRVEPQLPQANRSNVQQAPPPAYGSRDWNGTYGNTDWDGR